MVRPNIRKPDFYECKIIFLQKSGTRAILKLFCYVIILMYMQSAVRHVCFVENTVEVVV